VKDEDVEGVHDVLEDLEPVAVEDFTPSEPVGSAVGDDGAVPLFQNVEPRKCGHPIEGTHIGEDQAVVLAAGIPRLSNALLIGTLGRLAGLIEALACDVEQPTVITAADSFGLDPPVVEGSPSMAAADIEEAESPSSVTKEDEVLPQNSDGLRQAKELRELGSDSHRLPVAPEELSRRRSRADGRGSLVGPRRFPPVTTLSKLRHLGPPRII
jgi:hypothetical protein